MEFGNMYSTSRWTTPAHGSLFTGYYPSEIGTHSANHHLSTEKKTLAEWLSECGFNTIGFTENVNIDPFYDFDRGFDEFYRDPSFRDRPSQNPTKFEWGDFRHEIPDSGLNKYIEAIKKIYHSDSPTLPTLKTGLELLLSSTPLENTDSDWIYEKLKKEDISEDSFIFMNIMPCHFPYNPPDEYCDFETSDVEPIEIMFDGSLNTEEHHRRHWENYKSAAKYADDFIGKIINLFDWDALFIISDHGELFGEHQMRGHYFGMYEELVHIPGFAIGNEVPDRRVHSLSSILDIPRTLLSIVDAEVPESMRGIDLRKEKIGDRSVYAESIGSEWYRNNENTNYDVPEYWGNEHYMIRMGDKKLALTSNNTTYERVQSKNNSELSVSREDLETEVTRIRENMQDPIIEQKDDEVPEEISEQLKSLGYK
jgi:arylsulfatase